MIWRIKYTRTFLKELTVLAEEVRQPIENIAFGEQIKTDPFLSGKVKKLKGYTDFFKLKVGHYRVGLRIDISEKVIEFRRVLHRKDIYRKFP